MRYNESILLAQHDVVKGKSVKKIFTISALVLLMVTGCFQEPDMRPGLYCVLSGVIDGKTGKLVQINKEDAIKNDFEYHFRFKHNNTVSVHSADVEMGTDIYVPDKNMTRSYSLKRGKEVDRDMKFQFTEAFDSVEFLIVSEGTKYLFDCSQAK